MEVDDGSADLSFDVLLARFEKAPAAPTERRLFVYDTFSATEPESDDQSLISGNTTPELVSESDDETTKKITTTKVRSCHRCPSD